MAGKSKSNTTSSEILSQTDRVLLDLLRDGIAERSTIRNERMAGRAKKPEDTKRARLERNQERLQALFEEAVARPAINRTLRDAGFDIEELRAKAERASWREVVTAVTAVRNPAEREADDQRREAISEATRAIVDTHRNGARETKGAWINVLEEQVRASFGGRELRDAVVAQRLVAWTEAALNVVPGPVAAGARLALAEHAYGGMGREKDEPKRQSMRYALREVLTVDGSGQYARPSPDKPLPSELEPRNRETNRIWANDGEPSPRGERQVRDLVDAARSAEPATQASLLTRLRGYLGNRQHKLAVGEAASGDEDGIPDSLKRRYAIHVSEDRRTIELFEAGARAAAITLDAKSISTPHNEGAVIADIIVLARDRGWQSLKVAGTAEFRDAVWLEARKAGLVAQHEPSTALKAALEKWDRDRPSNQIQQAQVLPSGDGRRDDLARAFASKSPEQRLADPRFRNAQLVLTIGMRSAEKELGRPIGEMPDVAKALTATIREQLASGKVFDAPFVKPSGPKPVPHQAASAKIDADRIAQRR